MKEVSAVAVIIYFLVFCILGLAESILLLWLFTNGPLKSLFKRRQKEQNKKPDATSLFCADCGAELKPVDGQPDFYECPNCNQPGKN